MEREHGSGTVLDVLVIGKTNDFVRCFIGKPNGILILYPFEGAVGIAARLHFHVRDMLSGFFALGFDYAHGLTINKKGIIDLTRTGGELTNSHTKRSGEIQPFHVLNHPAGLIQLFINRKTRLFFRGHVLRHPFRLYTP